MIIVQVDIQDVKSKDSVKVNPDGSNAVTVPPTNTNGGKPSVDGGALKQSNKSVKAKGSNNGIPPADVENSNKKNLKKVNDAIDMGNVLLFEDYTDIERLVNDIRIAIVDSNNVKYIIFKNCISRSIVSAGIAQLYSEISSLVSAGKIEAGILFNNSMNDIFLKLPLVESGMIKIDLQLDKVTGVPSIIDSLDNSMIKDKSVTNNLIKLLNVLRLDNRTTELNYDSRLQKKEKIDVINSGKVHMSASYARYLEEMLSKCSISPNVRSVEINLVQSVISNEIIDLLILKFPNCKIIKSTRPVERSLVDYIKKNYKGIIPPSNVVVMDVAELDRLVKSLRDENDRELVRKVINHIAEVDSRNHGPLLDAVRIAIPSLMTGKEDAFKARKILEYFVNFPIGDTKVKFDFGDAALGKHMDALSKIADVVQPGMNIDQKRAILNYFVSILTSGKIGSARIPFFVGPPGSGKSVSIKVVGAMLGYLHWFLPGSPDKYINPSDEDMKKAMEFGVEAGPNFVNIFSLSSVSGKAAIDGGLKIYVSSDVGLLRLYCKKIEFGGKVYTPIFMGILFDEVDKTSKQGNNGEPPLLYSLMPFATTDTKAVDMFAELFGHITPIISIFAGNDAPEEFEALWNRTNEVRVSGFDNVQKRELIFRIFNDVVKASFPALSVYQSENGDININTHVRAAVGLGPWIIISNNSFNTIINVSGDDVGLRSLKDNLNSVLSILSVKCSKNLASGNNSTIFVNDENIGEYLPFIVSDKKNDVIPGSAVCALGVKGQKKAYVVKCSNNENTSQSKVILSPGPIQKQQTYQFASSNGGHDIGHLTFSSLMEILKNPSSIYKDSGYMQVSRRIKSLDSACPNNHWFVDVEYDLGDQDSPRIAGLAGVISYVSKLVNKSPSGFAIGYCESDGAFRPVRNAPECFKLCVNKMLDLDKLDAKNHQKIVVVLPRIRDDSNPYEKLGVPEKLHSLIQIKQADNIFDIINCLMFDEFDKTLNKTNDALPSKVAGKSDVIKYK
jgi:hypothetical protein